MKPGLRGTPEVTCLSPAALGGGVLALLWAETPPLYKETLIPLFVLYFHQYFLSTDYVLGTVWAPENSTNKKSWSWWSNGGDR